MFSSRDSPVSYQEPNKGKKGIRVYIEPPTVYVIPIASHPHYIACSWCLPR